MIYLPLAFKKSGGYFCAVLKYLFPLWYNLFSKIRKKVFIMEFNEKLQELRKKKGITQEELSEALFVSRTAVSKWESGRGYPNIDSLKAVARFFGVTVDELLSGDELLTVAEQDNKQKENHTRDTVFASEGECNLNDKTEYG